jgi:hypothetical protein
MTDAMYLESAGSDGRLHLNGIDSACLWVDSLA